MKAIARTLNEQRRKTPALMQMELLNKRLPNTQDGILKKYLWDATMVGRILKDESYIGTLILSLIHILLILFSAPMRR